MTPQDRGVSVSFIEPDSALTAWGQVHRDLRRRIDTGEFTAGHKIPTEVDLIEAYGVSRITIRRATKALADDGYVVSKRGSGTYVTDRRDVRCDLDLSHPWREQIVSTGHEASTHLVETHPIDQLPADIARHFPRVTVQRPLTFGRHIQTVDSTPIAITESWYSEFSGRELHPPHPAEPIVHARGFVEIGSTNARQAELLRSFIDIPLIVVITRSSLATTGEAVEFSRTSWLGSRVRLIYNRELTVAQIDMTQFLELE